MHQCRFLSVGSVPRTLVYFNNLSVFSVMPDCILGHFQKEVYLNLDKLLPTSGEAINNQYIHSGNITSFSDPGWSKHSLLRLFLSPNSFFACILRQNNITYTFRLPGMTESGERGTEYLVIMSTSKSKIYSKWVWNEASHPAPSLKLELILMFLQAQVWRIWIIENDVWDEGFMFEEYDCY